ncbi:MAG: hypothetical protein IPL53_20180 [Ignavibacteria bacterium]|nr:hypothetical protein [Ignavibacteria bacterium]
MKNSVSQQTYHAAPGFAVSLICINKSDWIYADYNQTKEQAFDKMQKNRFDVLPVREADGTFKKYFKAKEWGNFGVNDIKMFEIKPKDCIDHETSIKDAVKAFAKRNRNFFFLKNGKEVTGLLTAANLNSKHVYIYLYNLISQLEFELGRLINISENDDNELVRIFEENNKSVKPNTRYRREIKKGLDHKFIEFAYIGDMAWIIRQKNLHRKIGMTAKDFDSSIKLINKLRNIVAHPVNSLIKGKNSIVELDMTIAKIEVLTAKIYFHI